MCMSAHTCTKTAMAPVICLDVALTAGGSPAGLATTLGFAPAFADEALK
jgi:hypothetical protein